MSSTVCAVEPVVRKRLRGFASQTSGSTSIAPGSHTSSFVKEVGGEGPEWVNKVLESHTDLSDPAYERIKEFIRTWNL